MTGLYQLLKRSAFVREAVREHRIRAGRPEWSALLGEQLRGRLRDRGNGDGPNVLIATGGGGYLAGLHMDALLATALTLRGASCHVLLCDGALPGCLQCTLDWERSEGSFARRGTTTGHCRACHGGAEATYSELGIQVHRISELLDPDDVARAHALSRTTPLDSIRALDIDGVPVGEHAYAGALRFYARATLADPLSEIVLRRYLEAGIITALATTRLARSEHIDHAVVHHGIYIPQGVITDVMQRESAAVVTWHIAYRKKSFIFSHGGTYHRTLMTEPVHTWDQLSWTPELERRTVEYLQSRWYGKNDWIKFHADPVFDVSTVAVQTGIDFSRPCIGLLTNVMWDAQLHYPANAFPSMLEWLVYTVRYFERRPNLQLIIRVHPAETTGTVPSRQLVLQELATAFPVLPSNVFVIPPDSSVSTYALMSQCNAAIIYGTKTGVELTSMGVPVIVAGEAWIRDKGLTWDAGTIPEYEMLLDRLPLAHRLPDDVIARARKYAFHFFFRRMIPLDFLRDVPGQPPFRVEVTRLDELMPGRSRGLDVICDGILHGSEFVYPAEEELAVSATPSPAA